jgi:folate-dependent tRNA-U54 methylase TrmFO/GidA
VERIPSFTGLKVFSTTLARDREALSERITGWLREHPQFEVVDREVRQSSDKEFHCLSILLFYRERDR